MMTAKNFVYAQLDPDNAIYLFTSKMDKLGWTWALYDSRSNCHKEGQLDLSQTF